MEHISCRFHKNPLIISAKFVKSLGGSLCINIIAARRHKHLRNCPLQVGALKTAGRPGSGAEAESKGNAVIRFRAMNALGGFHGFGNGKMLDAGSSVRGA